MPDGGPLTEANSRIRDAAKWLMASSAAVGAALIAGSQLSNIGRLAATAPDTVDHARLWIAVAGAVVALSAVSYMIWTAVQLLVPHTVVVDELTRHWHARRGPMAGVVRFFRENRKYLQGYSTTAELVARRAARVERLAAADATEEDEAAVADLDQRIAAVEDMAAHLLLRERFRRSLGRLLGATAVAAVGIMAFAWAANPPVSAPVADLRNARLTGADLRGVDLHNARLDGADLSGADLTGADLSGASIVGVIWRGTICPDGTDSDQARGSCRGHLHRN
ncbi:pentapeptide repeat-containing protein [Dactylosporangium sp. CS-033363]|uniref:pentapeptide repeat-containing protein n=1 Tax=Dactylosporangium sp. CS-033363 TaxID=3239935 RepID=UPI003D8EA4C0